MSVSGQRDYQGCRKTSLLCSMCILALQTEIENPTQRPNMYNIHQYVPRTTFFFSLLCRQLKKQQGVRNWWGRQAEGKITCENQQNPSGQSFVIPMCSSFLLREQGGKLSGLDQKSHCHWVPQIMSHIRMLVVGLEQILYLSLTQYIKCNLKSFSRIFYRLNSTTMTFLRSLW